MTTAQDMRNQTTWSRSSSRKWLDGRHDFTDPGERVAFEIARERVRGGAVLDLGVGTGRTIPMLAPLTSDYLGIDYLPGMVNTCRTRFPHAKVKLGDARNLLDVSSKHFSLVSFSFNGIDAVGHDDRRRVLDEMRRVLHDDGTVVFSTLNVKGPAFRERPWVPSVARSRNPLLRAARTGRALASMPVDLVRWARLRASGERGDGWAVAPLSAHHYGVLAHFTSLERQLAELTEAGLDREVVILESTNGAHVARADDTSSVGWFHVVARKR
jgi:SAM-dependent methyltransferase